MVFFYLDVIRDVVPVLPLECVVPYVSQVGKERHPVGLVWVVDVVGRIISPVHV